MLDELKHRVLLKARHHWRKFNWADRLSVVLALVFLLAIGVSLVVHLFQNAAAAKFLADLAVLCLIVAGLLYLALGSVWRLGIRWERWVAILGICMILTAPALLQLPHGREYAYLAGETSANLVGIAYLVFMVRFLVSGMSEVVGLWAARVVLLLILVFFITFPPLIIFLATNGKDEAFPFWRATPRGWLDILESIALAWALLLLFMAPELAHRKLTWSNTSEPTKGILTNSLAAGAALSTGLYTLMLHFSKGPLAELSLGPLAVGILFAVALLVPIYRSVIRGCWQHGALHLVDLGRWWSVWQSTLKELRASVERPDREPEADDMDSDPGTAESPHSDDGVSTSQTARVTRDHPSDRRQPEQGHAQG